MDDRKRIGLIIYVSIYVLVITSLTIQIYTTVVIKEWSTIMFGIDGILLVVALGLYFMFRENLSALTSEKGHNDPSASSEANDSTDGS